MSEILQVVINQLKSGGCSDDKKLAWIDVQLNDGNMLRISFPSNMPADLIFSLQRLQGHIADEKRKAGFHVLETKYTESIQQVEFGTDALNQLAILTTRFQSGKSTSAVLAKENLPSAIQFLTAALRDFEGQSPKH